VLGLLIGGIAFAVTLYRDRIYGQDLSDLEYVAAVLTDDAIPEPASTISPTASSRTASSKAAASKRAS
jgi:hypothetical protein